MKCGEDVRDLKDKPVEGNVPRGVVVLQFVLVEKSPIAFTLRFVTNQGLLDQLGEQGALHGFLQGADHLYSDFRSQFGDAPAPPRPN